MTSKRVALRVFRAKQNMTQEEFCKKIGAGRSYYCLIEQGKRKATQDFWHKLQTAFNIPDAEMWQLMKIDGEIKND